MQSLIVGETFTTTKKRLYTITLLVPSQQLACKGYPRYLQTCALTRVSGSREVRDEDSRRTMDPHIQLSKQTRTMRD